MFSLRLNQTIFRAAAFSSGQGRKGDMRRMHNQEVLALPSVSSTARLCLLLAEPEIKISQHPDNCAVSTSDLPETNAGRCPRGANYPPLNWLN